LETMDITSNNANEQVPAEDACSWMSGEEREAIFAEIDALALTGAGRSAPGPEALRPAARKGGALFPILVNAAAALALAGGLFLLQFFHDRDEAMLRERASPLGLTERRLIQEIRRETAQRVEEKDAEIDGIRSKLAGVDREYQELRRESEREIAEAEERDRQNLDRLQSLRSEYQAALAGLQDERTRLLEGARLEEETLRSGPEAQAAAPAAAAPGAAAQGAPWETAATPEALDAARAELEGIYALVRDRVGEGRLEEAGRALQAAQDVLDAPSLRGVESWERTKKAQDAAIASLEALLRQASPEAAAETAELKARVSALEAEKAAAQEAAGADDGQAARRVAALEARTKELETLAAARQRAVRERDAALETLQGKVDAASRQAAERDAALTRLREENAALSNQIDELARQIGR